MPELGAVRSNAGAPEIVVSLLGSSQRWLAKGEMFGKLEIVRDRTRDGGRIVAWDPESEPTYFC